MVTTSASAITKTLTDNFSGKSFIVGKTGMDMDIK